MTTYRKWWRTVAGGLLWSILCIGAMSQNPPGKPQSVILNIGRDARSYSIRISPGTVLKLHLWVQPGTGSDYNIENLKTDHLKPVGKPEYVPVTPGLPGGMAHETLAFQATSTGETWIELRYKRAWMKNSKEDAITRVHVLVQTQSKSHR